MPTKVDDSARKSALAKARKLHIAKKYAEAAEAYGAALGGADDSDVLESRGWCYLRSEQHEKATADFERAGFRYGLAKIAVSLGRTEDAVALLKADLAQKDPSKYSKDLLAELLGKTKKAAPAAAPPKKRPAAAEPAPIPARKKGETYDAYVERLLDAARLTPAHRRAIDAARVPAALLVPGKGAAKVGQSRLGGLPDLPPGQKWPSHQGTPMLFVMQVRLEEVASLLGPKTLPSAGLLSFFACEGLAHDEYLDAGAVIFTPAKACAKVAPAALSAGFARTYDGEKINKPFGARKLTAAGARKLPNPDGHELAKAKVPAEVRVRYSERVFEPAMASEEGGRHQLMGVRDRSYPGDQPKTMSLLLQCVTEPGSDMHWGDDDAIAFFAPRADLAKGVFSKVRLSYGD